MRDKYNPVMIKVAKAVVIKMNIAAIINRNTKLMKIVIKKVKIRVEIKKSTDILSTILLKRVILNIKNHMIPYGVLVY